MDASFLPQTLLVLGGARGLGLGLAQLLLPPQQGEDSRVEESRLGCC
jgi:NAD(P)-dependent dehydrogenase (short-subunit alcohol dehydrogenase family)